MKKYPKEINLNKIKQLRCKEEESFDDYAPDPNQDYQIF